MSQKTGIISKTLNIVPQLGVTVTMMKQKNWKKKAKKWIDFNNK